METLIRFLMTILGLTFVVVVIAEIICRWRYWKWRQWHFLNRRKNHE